MAKKITLWFGYFVIATAISWGFYQVIPYAQRMQKKYTNIRQIEALIDVVRTYPYANMFYNGLNNSFFYEHKVGHEMVAHQDKSIENMQGGQVFVLGSPARLGSKINDSFVISLVWISRDQCIDLATYDWRKLSNAKVLGIVASSEGMRADIEGEGVYADCNGLLVPDRYVAGCLNGNNISIPVSRDDAKQACHCYRGSGCSFSIKLY